MQAREPNRLSVRGAKEVRQALVEIEAGRSYTHEEVAKMLFGARDQRRKPPSH